MHFFTADVNEVAEWGTDENLFCFTPSFRDDWSMKHFLHPKLLRKAREVRSQLEDIMKMQKMAIISAGTEYDIVRYVVVLVSRG